MRPSSQIGKCSLTYSSLEITRNDRPLWTLSSGKSNLVSIHRRCIKWRRNRSSEYISCNKKACTERERERERERETNPMGGVSPSPLSRFSRGCETVGTERRNWRSADRWRAGEVRNCPVQFATTHWWRKTIKRARKQRDAMAES